MDNQVVNAVTGAVADQAKQAANAAAKGIYERLFDAYQGFVGIFPEQYQWIISLVLILAVASFLFKLIKKNWLWLVLAVVLFPGLLLVLQNFFNSLVALFIGKSIGQ